MSDTVLLFLRKSFLIYFFKQVHSAASSSIATLNSKGLHIYNRYLMWKEYHLKCCLRHREVLVIKTVKCTCSNNLQNIEKTVLQLYQLSKG